MIASKARIRGTIHFFLFLFLLFLLAIGRPILAAETAQLDITMTYGQSEARTMLKMINQFRQGEEAWAWDISGEQRMSYENLPALHYDYELEKAAMIRAAEIAFVFSHTRPTGEGCFTVGGIDSADNIYGRCAGENIGTGYATSAEVFDAWKETDKDYEGQAHRRTMLTAEYRAVGIGHVIYRGVHYWVQQYGTRSKSATTPAPSVNGIGNVSLRVPVSWITSLDVKLVGGKSLENLCYGEKAKLPAVKGSVTLGRDHVFDISSASPWVSEDPSVATVVCGWVYAHKAGTVTLYMDTAGRRLYHELTIAPIDLSRFAIMLDETADTLTREPPITLTDGNLTLKEGEDYTLTYAPSYRPNYVTVIARGQGNYAGTLQTILKVPDLPTPTPVPEITKKGQKQD